MPYDDLLSPAGLPVAKKTPGSIYSRVIVSGIHEMGAIEFHGKFHTSLLEYRLVKDRTAAQHGAG